jgi:hypothetical protein
MPIFSRQILQSLHSLLFARLNPPPKLGKYSGGVKSEILNATEEKSLGRDEHFTKNDFHRRRRDRI